MLNECLKLLKKLLEILDQEHDPELAPIKKELRYAISTLEAGHVQPQIALREVA